MGSIYSTTQGHHLEHLIIQPGIDKYKTQGRMAYMRLYKAYSSFERRKITKKKSGFSSQNHPKQKNCSSWLPLLPRKCRLRKPEAQLLSGYHLHYRPNQEMTHHLSVSRHSLFSGSMFIWEVKNTSRI